MVGIVIYSKWEEHRFHLSNNIAPCMQVNVKYIKGLITDLLGQSNHGNEDGARKHPFEAHTGQHWLLVS